MRDFAGKQKFDDIIFYYLVFAGRSLARVVIYKCFRVVISSPLSDLLKLLLIAR